jgi:hypothetical protein
VTDLEERMEKMRTSAREHEGRYLLRRRFRRPEPYDLKSDTDKDWDAAEALVDRGEARWISRYSTLHPGIEFRNL